MFCCESYAEKALAEKGKSQLVSLSRVLDGAKHYFPRKKSKNDVNTIKFKFAVLGKFGTLFWKNARLKQYNPGLLSLIAARFLPFCPKETVPESKMLRGISV